MESISCTNCGLDIEQFVRIQNAVEDEGGNVPEYCCDDEEGSIKPEMDEETNVLKTQEGSIKMESGQATQNSEVVPTEEVKTDVQLVIEEVNNVPNEEVLEEVPGVVREAVALIQKLQGELDEYRAAKAVKESNNNVKKNQKPGKASATRKYVLLNKDLAKWGKVPLQQQEIANLLSKNLEVGKQYAESEVFDILVDKCGDYPSLCNSKQDPTYLFRYYRGLKNNGKHAGLVARNFIRVIG